MRRLVFVLAAGLAGGLDVVLISFVFLPFLLLLKYWHTLELPARLFCWGARS